MADEKPPFDDFIESLGEEGALQPRPTETADEPRPTELEDTQRNLLEQAWSVLEKKPWTKWEVDDWVEKVKGAGSTKGPAQQPAVNNALSIVKKTLDTLTKGGLARAALKLGGGPAGLLIDIAHQAYSDLTPVEKEAFARFWQEASIEPLIEAYKSDKSGLDYLGEGINAFRKLMRDDPPSTEGGIGTLPEAAPSPNRLLVMGCSAKKSPAECAIEARKMYKGSLWEIFNKSLGGEENVIQGLKDRGIDVGIFSAEHGFMHLNEKIPPYDKKLTTEAATALAGDEAKVQKVKDALARYDPSSITLAMGKNYRDVFEEMAGKKFNYLGGGIGQQRGELKKFFERTGTEAPIETVKEGTPELKKWFGKGAVRDPQDNPRKLFHLTFSDFDVFEIGEEELGFHIGSAHTAENRLELKRQEAERDGELLGPPSTIPLYTNIKNPLRLPESRTGGWKTSDVIIHIRNALTFRDDPRGFDHLTSYDDPQLLENLKLTKEEEGMFFDEVATFKGKEIEIGEMDDQERSDFIREWLKSKGFDSIVYDNRFEGGGDSYLIFEPTQVKSIFNLRPGQTEPEFKSGGIVTLPEFAEGGSPGAPMTVDQRVQEVWGLEPGIQRPGFLPMPDIREAPSGGPPGTPGKLSMEGWTAPEWLYDLATMNVLPGHAAQGGQWSEEDVTRGALALAGTTYTGASLRGATPDPSRLAMFGGVRARGSDKKALAEAERMVHNPDNPPEEIWKQTGWEIDPQTGDRRFEISDHGVDMDAVNKTLKEGISWRDIDNSLKYGLAEILPHPELKKAYPELFNVTAAGTPAYKVQVVGSIEGGSGGYYDKAAKTIVLSREYDNPASALLHEVQHIIQGIEGWQGGASPEMFAKWGSALPGPARRMPHTTVQLQLMKKFLEALENRGLKLKDVDSVGDMGVVLKNPSGGPPGWLPSSQWPSAKDLGFNQHNLDKVALIVDDIPHKDPLRKTLTPKLIDQMLSNREKWLTPPIFPRHMAPPGAKLQERIRFENYMRTKGEVQSRSSQRRQDLTPEERRNLFPTAQETDELLARQLRDPSAVPNPFPTQLTAEELLMDFSHGGSVEKPVFRGVGHFMKSPVQSLFMGA